MSPPTDHTVSTKQTAALRQIGAAIAHIEKMELEAAITLAAAAEGLLPETEEPHVFGYLRQHPAYRDKQVDFNETINWLKHATGPDMLPIFEREAALIVFRAMSKYGAVYKDAPSEWEEFLRWGAAKGYFPNEIFTQN